MNETTQLFAEYPDVVSAEQLMEMLSISRATAYRLLSDKKIPAIKVGRQYRIPKNRIISYLMSCYAPVAADEVVCGNMPVSR